ncbi:MAG: hypothetical protein A2806_03110 [Candidatus Terrybacteria bacterium RIFCSPHIGHO2_01_FULL_48_17]|uniref:CYTH domain-containing protein n=1 Tax=Candidatus Terrybacteria bacterium RIFCSPHIGHO2_01_FULL_48_17 TaxID=1802362 RepID=A0A1G2PJB1_9BACT|nr:MAG: hypothetical protein A2806_03110 [Candidatus Terrybacteria bacterium RIFCSPHIGHO2_01_FULL_48_17]OHA53040.1 MAG: hypothetical protein A3A30_02525 [Candidatus Terrybacteria bacterium RIFCSPLOWO2_01_FULL_48_14]
MKEIEVKFSVKDFERIRRNLKQRGAKLLWKGIEQNYFFDTKNRQLKKRREVLRVKKIKKKRKDVFLLTFKTGAKGRDVKFKARDEYEIEINDFLAMQRILQKLGFHPWFRYQKRREHWKLGKLSIELDEVRGRRFVELEGEKRGIEKLARELTLHWGNSTTKGYLSILNAYARRKN